jgi:PAS domain S-box-containing protein
MTDTVPTANPSPAASGPDAPGQLLQTLLDAIPYPVFYKDLQGRFLGCNRAFETARGVSRQELTGKTVFDLLPMEEARRLDLKDRELLAAGGKETFSQAVYNPFRGVREVLINKGTFNHADGSLAGIMTTYMDITEQKEAEAALRQSQDLLSTISQNVSDLMAIVDPAGRRLYTSPSYPAVLGYSLEELDRFSATDIIHPEDRPLVVAALADLFGQNRPQSAEYRLRHKNGHWLCFESMANPIAHPSGRPAQALIVARDVTARRAAELERKQMEVQLRHAQKLESIGSLAAGIAHEINTPTQYIGDNTTFLGGALPDMLACLDTQRRFLLGLQSGQALPEGAAELLRQIGKLDLDYLAEEIPKAIRQTLEGVARVTAIVSAMKDFSHPGGEGKLLTDLNKAIESTLTVSRSEWKYVATLEADLDPALPPVPCLQGEVNQAILNLVVNAAHAVEDALGGRHTGKLGVIKVATRLVGREVRISVSDTGNGIPESIRERIFEPFFTTKPVGRGTGQGLAIVHAVVVEKHGGRVTLETEPGRGTTFHLFLPLGTTPDPS